MKTKQMIADIMLLGSQLQEKIENFKLHAHHLDYDLDPTPIIQMIDVAQKNIDVQVSAIAGVAYSFNKQFQAIDGGRT